MKRGKLGRRGRIFRNFLLAGVLGALIWACAGWPVPDWWELRRLEREALLSPHSQFQGSVQVDQREWLVGLTPRWLVMGRQNEFRLWPREGDGPVLAPVPEEFTLRGGIRVVAAGAPQGTASAQLTVEVSHWYASFGGRSSYSSQREDILEALDEGILAIDRDCVITYMNAACLGMFGAKAAEDVLGRPLREIYPASQLPRLLTTGKPEYNVHLKQMPGSQEVLANRMPIWEDGEIVGAVAVFRDRTEVTNLAEALTGSRHLVEAMRAYAHEFINKLHTILGLIQLDRVEQAEQYILDVSEVHHQSVSRVMNQIEDTAVAALLVGKASRAAELGIQLQVDPRSSLSGEEHMLPSGVMVTILGNLIENATESLNHSTRKQKEIHVSILENPDGLLLYVEDTGPGILPELLPYIFEPGVSTKGEAGHGLGLVQIKDLTDLYHGQIRVESEPKSGTSFFLSFPAHSTPSPQGGAPGSP